MISMDRCNTSALSHAPHAQRLFLLAILSLLWPLHHSDAAECRLSDDHQGLTFPLHRIDEKWQCRLQPIVMDYTTVGTTGPVRTPLPARLYDYFLNHPVISAGLAQRLGIGPYRASWRGANQFWINDGDGTQGLVTLLYQDEATRIYHIDGFHESRLFPTVPGQAVMLLNVRSVKDDAGVDSVEHTLVSYVKLESRMLSAVVSLLRPLVGDTITRKLARGFDAANQLSRQIAQDRERVLREATTPPLLSSDDLESLRLALHESLRMGNIRNP